MRSEYNTRHTKLPSEKRLMRMRPSTLGHTPSSNGCSFAHTVKSNEYQINGEVVKNQRCSLWFTHCTVRVIVRRNGYVRTYWLQGGGQRGPELACNNKKEWNEYINVIVLQGIINWTLCAVDQTIRPVGEVTYRKQLDLRADRLTKQTVEPLHALVLTVRYPARHLR